VSHIQNIEHAGDAICVCFFSFTLSETGGLSEWCHIFKILEMPRHLLRDMRSFTTEDVRSHLEMRIPHTHTRISRGRCGAISKILDMWHCWKILFLLGRKTKKVLFQRRFTSRFIWMIPLDSAALEILRSLWLHYLLWRLSYIFEHTGSRENLYEHLLTQRYYQSKFQQTRNMNKNN